MSSKINFEEVNLEMQEHRILVQLDPIAETTAGGIAIPDPDSMQRVEGRFRTGRVMAVGPGALSDIPIYTYEQVASVAASRVDGFQRKPMNCKVGDRVLFHKRIVNERTFISGELFIMIGDRDVAAIIGDEVDIGTEAFVRMLVKPSS